MRKLFVSSLLFASSVIGLAGCGAPDEPATDSVEVSAASVTCRTTSTYSAPVDGVIRNIFCHNTCASPIIHCTWSDSSGPHAVAEPTTGLVSEAFTACSKGAVCE
jgi:hypothetical protein